MSDAKAIFDADDSRFQAVAGRIQKRIEGMKASFRGFVTSAATALALPAAAWAALSAGTLLAIEDGRQFELQSRRTGATAGEIYQVGKEFRAAGEAAEGAVPAMQKMMVAIQDGTANKIIEDMGVNLEALKKASPAAQFNTLGKAINNLPAAAERVEAARAIFGKEGMNLVGVFATKGFGDSKINNQADILDHSAALFQDTSISLKRAGINFESLFLGVASRVAPLIKEIADYFAKVDLSAWGQEIGDAIALIGQAIKDGTIADILLDELELALANAGNFLAGVFLAQGAVLMDVMMKAAAAFTNFLLEGIARVLDALSKIPRIGKYAGDAANVIRAAQGSISGFTAQHSDIGKDIAASMERGKIFDTDTISNRLGGRLEGALDKATDNRVKAEKEAQQGPRNGGSLEDERVSPNVSALQRVGGNYGGGSGGDPLLEANRLHRENNGLLIQIRDRLTPVSGALRKPGTAAYA